MPFPEEKKTKGGESYSFSLFPTDFAEKSEWFDKSLLSKKKWVAKMIPSFFFIYFLCCISTLLLKESININRMNLKSSTGCSLSDQHILSPINPKYKEWFCQIYEDLHKLFWNSKLECNTCVLNFRTVCVNFRKNDKMSCCILV